jgi:putative ATP-dependent endonuclease of the OLD family
LQEFLGPTFKDVSLSLSERSRIQTLARSAQFLVDDGTRTTLQRKGDGVKSLVAISLMTRALESDATAKDAILLIEEPESHLHPKAIHQLREVLDSLKKDRQIIVTTHCPVLINRADVSSNIVVSKSKASPAKSLDQLRQILGVRASDNLRHAALVIVVEGTDDTISLSALFSSNLPKLQDAIASGSIAFDALGGASKLRYGLSQLQSALCNYYVVLDDDAEARRAFDEASKEGLVSQANCSFLKCVSAFPSPNLRIFIPRNCMQSTLVPNTRLILAVRNSRQKERRKSGVIEYALAWHFLVNRLQVVRRGLIMMR